MCEPHGCFRRSSERWPGPPIRRDPSSPLHRTAPTSAASNAVPVRQRVRQQVGASTTPRITAQEPRAPRVLLSLTAAQAAASPSRSPRRLTGDPSLHLGEGVGGGLVLSTDRDRAPRSTPHSGDRCRHRRRGEPGCRWWLGVPFPVACATPWKLLRAAGGTIGSAKHAAVHVRVTQDEREP